ncbi:hypothetical protein [Massilia sp. YIM B04103]|uniref:hypothetical protein n=1 Tax=Massilia sp. YIM B04103 TaxID=2963106 RepID=UPI002108EADF|nr:hypothetical protein [Massilia sp. YIM B04103]
MKTDAQQTGDTTPEDNPDEVCYRDVCPSCPSTEARYRCWEVQDGDYMHLYWRVFCRDCGHMSSGVHTVENSQFKQAHAVQGITP